MEDNGKWITNIINVVFLFFGNKIKGYRTIIVSVGAAIIGAWEWITGSGLFIQLCNISETFQALVVFCDIDSTKFYAIVLVIIGAIQLILRKVTDTPIGEKANHSALTTTQKVVTGAIAVPLVAAGFVVVWMLLVPYLLSLIGV